MKKLQTDGAVRNLNRGRSGRRRDIRTPENINAVRCSAIQSPKNLLLRVGHESNEHCPYFETGFELFPCRIRIKHPLTANDEKTRVYMCNWFIDKMG